MQKSKWVRLSDYVFSLWENSLPENRNDMLVDSSSWRTKQEYELLTKILAKMRELDQEPVMRGK